MTGDEPFLARWSRRKGAAAAEAPEQSAPVMPESGGNPVDQADVPAQDIAAPDLPDVGALDRDSDYTVFLAENVPVEIQRLALRTLWRSDPVLANLDGLNDYDEDFASALREGAEFMRKLAQKEAESENDGTVDGLEDGEATDPEDDDEMPDSDGDDSGGNAQLAKRDDEMPDK